VRTGKPSTQMAWRDVTRNLVIANYGGSKEVDNDDGSLFWRIHSNVMAFGFAAGTRLRRAWPAHISCAFVHFTSRWGQKFKCGAIESFDNLKLFIELGSKFDAGCLLGNDSLRTVHIKAEDGVVYPNRWYNDTMIHLGNVTFEYRQCWGRTSLHDWDREAVHDNRIYVQSAEVRAFLWASPYPQVPSELEPRIVTGDGDDQRRRVRPRDTTCQRVYPGAIPGARRGARHAARSKCTRALCPNAGHTSALSMLFRYPSHSGLPSRQRVDGLGSGDSRYLWFRGTRFCRHHGTQSLKRRPVATPSAPVRAQALCNCMHG
jgi:hypothetical protein